MRATAEFMGADEGVAVFKRHSDGDVEYMNKVDIDGMRGCYLSVDKTGKYLFVAGYHDGKVTVVHTRRDGSLGSVMDGVFHRGLGSVAERSFRPHVTCVVPSPNRPGHIHFIDGAGGGYTLASRRLKERRAATWQPSASASNAAVTLAGAER